MDAIPIRNARRGDVPSLLLLWSAMLEENARFDPRLTPHPDARESAAGSFAQRVEDPDEVVLVAEDGRVPIGFAAGKVTPGNGFQVPGRLGQITDCYVIPARRRRGAGRRLASRMADLLVGKGAETIRLQVVVKNAEAEAFWASLGYAPLEVIFERAIAKPAGAPPAAPPPATS
jgi:ribosomal protein S18 acetylase RimI-like enzyme